MSIRSRRWEKHSVKPGPRVRWVLSVLFLLTATIAVSQQAPAGSAAPEPTQSSATQAPTTQAPGPEASSQAPQAEAQGAAPLRVHGGQVAADQHHRAAQANFRHRRRYRRRHRGHADPDPGAWPGRGRSVAADLGRTGAFAQLRFARRCRRHAPRPKKKSEFSRTNRSRSRRRAPPSCFPATFPPKMFPSAPE